ncbi:MAG: hypothetical protein WBQ73_03655 [Candidatus Babeliales bacterium]
MDIKLKALRGGIFCLSLLTVGGFLYGEGPVLNHKCMSFLPSNLIEKNSDPDNEKNQDTQEKSTANQFDQVQFRIWHVTSPLFIGILVFGAVAFCGYRQSKEGES